MQEDYIRNQVTHVNMHAGHDRNIDMTQYLLGTTINNFDIYIYALTSM